MKILEVCPYSAGICGVWTRVLEESKRLNNLGFEIKIFSSNAVKGTNEIAKEREEINGIKILRFPFKKLGGESFMSWNFEKEALNYSPDIIIAHNYRHLHTTKCLKIAEKLRGRGKKCKVFLVTHAPFERRLTRTFLQNLIVSFYDFFIGRQTINKFDKILAITKWEMPYLLKLGAKEEKIIYIPNGIPEEFFSLKKRAKEENKILFLGRISKVKNLETAIKSMAYLKDKKIKLEIVGPAERNYFIKLKNLIQELGLNNRIKFSPPIYNLKEKIAKIDSCKIFILPSKSEGMPQSLIEAMAREKIVIGSNSLAIRDLIKDKENGFLFEFDNPKDLAKKIDEALQQKNLEIKK
ncbi:MAG: glycosyltransferase family 4 protein, partial [Nanoarchaeota archaeon]|nr:glycosyltransferase family 4 protein [Nanoarchaeota archaeon]